jgi:ribosome-binding protein aMBF1 (putative translation factor)
MAHADRASSIGENIRQAREARGISRRTMAKVIDCHHSTITALESHDAYIGIVQLLKMVAYMEMSLLDVIPADLLHAPPQPTYRTNGAQPAPRRTRTKEAR